MKKILFAVLLLMGMSYYVQAQEHQVSVGFGAPSSNHIADLFFTVAKDMITGLAGGDSGLENKRSVGEFRAGYAYYPTERMSVGATVSILQTAADAVRSGTSSGEYSTRYLTFAAEGTYNYLTREKFRLYGLIGAGVTNLNARYTVQGQNESDNANVFNFHLSPIGAAFGRQFGGTAEVGFGYRGIVSLGLFYKF